MDAPTVGVLRDVTLLVWLALLIGVAAYKGVRLARPAACWNLGGRVEARSYSSADAIVVAAIGLLLLGGMREAAPAATPGADDAAAELSVGPLAGSIAIQLCFCAFLLFYLLAVRGLNPADLFGLRQMHPLRAAGMALTFMVPTLIVVLGLSVGVNAWMQSFWPEVGAQDTVEAFRTSKDPAAKAMLVVAAVLVAPLVEETIFRGFIYGVLKRFTDGFFAAVCSALLFAVVHFHAGSLFPLAVLALMFCAAYEITGSLLVPMVMHSLFNSTSIALMIFFPEAR